ncbi:hypothetical protein N9063_01120 [Deltaproteobacteria bacterium]|nr:hypothetical protein [Deltaproteobacteria bacterium]
MSATAMDFNLADIMLSMLDLAVVMIILTVTMLVYKQTVVVKRQSIVSTAQSPMVIVVIRIHVTATLPSAAPLTTITSTFSSNAQGTEAENHNNTE